MNHESEPEQESRPPRQMTQSDLKMLKHFVDISNEVKRQCAICNTLKKELKEYEAAVKAIMIETSVDTLDLQTDGLLEKRAKKNPSKRPGAKALPQILESFIEEHLDDIVLEDQRGAKVQQLCDILLGKTSPVTHTVMIKHVSN